MKKKLWFESSFGLIRSNQLYILYTFVKGWCLFAADWLSSPDSIPVPSWVELRALEDADLIRELVRGNHDASRSRSISQAYIQHRSPHPEERN